MLRLKVTVFAVRDNKGKEAYTRAGDFKMTAEGQLQTGSGLAVLSSEGQPLTIPVTTQLSIGVDGTISIRPAGDANAPLINFAKLKLVKPDMKNIEKGLDGLVYIKDGSPQVDNAEVEVSQGVIEGSNVNAIGAMVKMIELARNFEMQTNIMKNAKENSAASTKLLQM